MSSPVSHSASTPLGPETIPPQPAEPEPERGGVLNAIVRAVPILLVLTLLGTVGALGHATGWKMPKLSALTGEEPQKDDWCSDHNVPASICVECNAELLPRPPWHGWCDTHGVHECPLCNPDVAQLLKPSAVTSTDLDRAKRALEFTDRTENSRKCKLHQRRLQLASAEAANKTGLDVLRVSTAPVTEAISAPGEITYDQVHVAHLSARSPGTVFRVFKKLGDRVQAGDLLALIDAAEVGRAKAELRQAVAQVDTRTQTLASLRSSAGVVKDARVREEEAALKESRIRVAAARQALVNLGLKLDEADITDATDEPLNRKLQFLGIPADVAKSLDPKTTTSNLLPVIAPLEGVITSLDVVASEVVDLARVLFEVVDTRHLWLTLDVSAEDARRVRIGQQVRFKLGGSKEEVPGTISWRASQADPKTRTVKVRAELPNTDGRYLANTFGTGRIILREEPAALVVPTAAIHWEGCCHIVFVRDKNYDPLKKEAPKVFHIRSVRIGSKDGTNTEIVAGLLPGELVATKNSEALRGELFRNSFGEGCCPTK